MAPHDRDTAADTFRCVCVGCFCCYNGWDCQNPLLCCKCSEDFLCLRCSSCLACNAPSRGCGCVGDSRRGELCKIGCFCCNMGIAVPTKLCSCAGQCCCCLQVVSCPCTPEFVPCPGVLTLWFLGCCCIQVMPKCGCCVAAPPCPALDKYLRGDDDMVPETQKMIDRDDDPKQGKIEVVTATAATTPAMRKGPSVPAAQTTAVPVRSKANAPPAVVAGGDRVTVTVHKPTPETHVGLAFRTTTDGAVRVSAVAEDSLFGPQYQTDDIQKGMTVISINGHFVTSKDEAYSIIQASQKEIRLVAERTKVDQEKGEEKKKEKKKHKKKKTKSSRPDDSNDIVVDGSESQRSTSERE